MSALFGSIGWVMNIATGAQIRMARAYLKWSAEGLANKSGIGLSTVKRIESSDGLPSTRIENLQAVYDAIVATGKVRFEGDSCVCVVSQEIDKT